MKNKENVGIKTQVIAHPFIKLISATSCLHTRGKGFACQECQDKAEYN